MPAWAKTALDTWTQGAGIRQGHLFRALSPQGALAAGLTAQAVYLIVRAYARQIGVRLAPTTCARTFGKLAHGGHSPIEQIQLSLGHDSIQTTERYLGIQQSLTDAPCDHLGIRLEASGTAE